MRVKIYTKWCSLTGRILDFKSNDVGSIPATIAVFGMVLFLGLLGFKEDLRFKEDLKFKKKRLNESWMCIYEIRH